MSQTADNSFIDYKFRPDTLQEISCRWTFQHRYNSSSRNTSRSIHEFHHPNPRGTNEFFIQPCAHQTCASTVYTFWFCGWHNFLLPLQEFTRCRGGVSATLSFSQHICMAFLDTICATCPIPSLLHGKTNSLAPPAALTPQTPPLKNNYHSQKTANPDESTFSSLLCFSLPLLHGQMTESPAGGKRPAAQHFGRSSSTQLLLIDSSKGSKASFKPLLSNSLSL